MDSETLTDLTMADKSDARAKKVGTKLDVRLIDFSIQKVGTYENIKVGTN